MASNFRFIAPGPPVTTKIQNEQVCSLELQFEKIVIGSFERMPTHNTNGFGLSISFASTIDTIIDKP